MKTIILIFVLLATQLSFAQKTEAKKSSDLKSKPGKATSKTTKKTSAQSVVKSLKIKPTVSDSASKKIQKKFTSTEESVKDIYKKEIQFKRSKETTETLWLVSRITLGVASLGMAGMGFYHTNQAEDGLKEQRNLYVSYTELGTEADPNSFIGIRDQYDDLEEKVDTHISKASIYYGLSFFLTAGFLVTFAF